MTMGDDSLFFTAAFGTPVINQPQVAILGIGTIEKRPAVVTDADWPRTVRSSGLC